jgi:hypothetical protein
MEMLLGHLTHVELAAIFEKNRRRSPAPHLIDPRAIARARRLAKVNGIWDELTTQLDPHRDIPHIKWSKYRAFARTGDRQLYEQQTDARNRELGRAHLAVWLGHPKADIDYLQDLLWAVCDTWTWVMNAHENRLVDLGAAMLGARLAEVLYTVGDRLDPEVTGRVRAETERRIFDNFCAWRSVDFWKSVRMNWNHVCNGDILRTALYLIEDPVHLANIVHPAVNNMTYALEGFTADGGCQEGPGYWMYGFGHYLLAAHALYQKTNGAINIMQGEKVERICRYPLANHIAGPHFGTFADCKVRYLPPLPALIINQFFKLPELYELCAPHQDQPLRLAPDRTVTVARRIKLAGIHDLTLYRGEKVTGRPDQTDCLLPDLGQAKLKGKPGQEQMILMVLAGNNGVPHNHNDIGSFIVHKHGTCFLTDPGAPAYSKKVFQNETRYQIVYCNSLGHSVPIINGRQQEAGARYCGVLTTENLNGPGIKRAVIDMSRAYPAGTMRSLVRTFLLDADRNMVTLEDAYTFDRPPRALEEAFITLEEKVTIERNGRAVRIRGKQGSVLLTAQAPGRFRVNRLAKESKADGPGNHVITRITFKPRTLKRDMRLAFFIG